MVSVTQRIRQVKQPRGGYIHPKTMEVRYLGSGGVAAVVDHTLENVHASLVGLAVDYLTRSALGRPAAEVFTVSVAAAGRLGDDWRGYALDLCDLIEGSRGRVLALPNDESARHALPNPKNPNWATDREVYLVPDDEAIKAAIKLASFDVIFRAGMAAYNPDARTDPDAITREHIAEMIAASLAFAWEYGPVLVDGFTMLGGYTKTVDTGDGDFVTRDTLWDFKVSVNPPTKDDTLQLLMYWLMARRSDWNWRPTWHWDHSTSEPDWLEAWDLDDYLLKNRAWPDDLRGPAPTHIGVYNPRLDAIYRLAVDGIPADVIEEVSREVIGYV
ncbi:MAG: hypothetical protein ABIR17_09465 [Pseudolysinimonas sp.]|uniref:hypothetical protein n=1 Tax=Pseudolysinimonas sp. TaxID=2680009 RepID=UPI00326623C5